MTQPTYAQWRNESQPILNGSNVVVIPGQQIIERVLAALACYVTQTNPDGTPFTL